MTEQASIVGRERPSRWPWAAALLLCVAHGLGSWRAMGGWVGVSGPWPLAIHDHPDHQHSAWVARPPLMRTGLAAGYDPFFMAGYAMNLSSSPSSTVFEVAALLTGGAAPAVVYKVLTFLGLASLPWIVAAAGAVARLGGAATASSLACFLLYVWTEGGGGGFPLNYALFGMTAYLVVVPLGLFVVALFARYLTAGGFGPWIAVAAAAAAAFLVHLTILLVLAPAAMATYFASLRGSRRLGLKGHAAVLTVPIVVLALNSFWWLPAYWLRATRAPNVAFLTNSDESPWARIVHVAWGEAPIQSVLLALGMVGLVFLARRDKLLTAGLAAFALAGFGLGYLAAGVSRLDFLQPGRQTYALYAALSLLAGVGVAEILGSMGRSARAAATLAAFVGLVLVGIRIFGPSVARSVGSRLDIPDRASSRPFLDSSPPPHLASIVRWIGDNVPAGERIFYEESGLGLPDDPDPFDGGRYSGLLPRMTGVEVVGGFYLYLGLETNFTQVGAERLFGESPWTREQFVRYARVYRPTAIVCWSRSARRFCEDNPDLIRVNLREGRVLAGRVVGFEGAAIRGRAEVRPEPGRLHVSAISPDLDGLVVLRYHVAPGLRSTPAGSIEPVSLEGDPVPFVGLRPAPGQTEAILEMRLPPSR